jgi:hypothetical protein
VRCSGPRRGIAIALGASMLLAGAAAASAAGIVTPPAGTPNLALMVLQPSDLVPGATIAAQRYIAPPTGFTADYGSEFNGAATTDGVKYLAVVDFIALAPTASLASTYYAAQDNEFATAEGRAKLITSIIKSAGKKAHMKRKDVTFSAAASAGLGSSSLTETITLKLGHAKYREVVAVFEEGDFSAALEITGTANEAVPQADAVALATTIQSHINTVLASTGTTGLTGTS